MMMMMMEAANLEENQNQMMIIKGKRTKRPRLSSPMVLTTTASSSSSPGDVEDHHHHNQLISTTPVRVSDQDDDDDDDTTVSPVTSSADEFTEMSTTEEEDMANCLILLAQSGQTQIRKAQEQEQLVLLQQQAPIKAVAAADTAPGFYVYECKTCNRCFSSFQALGGHRASHKKPKLQAASNVINTTQAQPKKALSFMEDQDEYDRRFNYNATSTTLSLQISNRGFGHSRGTNKVHECSVCGAEFASGQALGGHMRRHRTFITPTATAPTMSSTPQSQVTNKRPRSVLELDLNLPAPEEERLEMTKLPFSSSKKEQVIVFSSSALVGCHY